MTLPRLLICFALFEAAWFACIAGAAHGAPGWGIAAVLVSIGVQLILSGRRNADLLLIAAALACGLVWDTALAQAKLVIYSSHVPLPAIAPAWILALWAQLGSVLREPLRWLHDRPWLAMGLGAIGGSVSYAGAARMGACEFPEPALAMGALAAGWGVMVPLLLRLARRIDRQARSMRAVNS